MKNWFTSIGYHTLPGLCVLCQARSLRKLDLCGHCQRDLRRPKKPCWQCGLEHSENTDTCNACVLSPPPYSHCFSLYRYEFPISALINRFKNQHKLSVGKVLSTLLARGYVKQHFLFPDFWVPVPLHSSIKQARGFNQAEELALSLAELSAKPLLLGGIERVKKTQNQKQLGSLERQANMKNAFACCIDLHGKTIGIVDDVITTGATVGALTTTLLDAGAADVQVVCVARTPAK